MDIVKSDWGIHDNNIVMHMPLTKVDEEKRLVSGFAILDNDDKQKDRVLATASRKAFADFRGNIREMHQPIAAGKLVDFVEKSFFDPKSKQTYTGIYVTVYVSRGAEDTWQKVLDGTLTGFSIGGSVKDSEMDLSKSGESIRVVKAYELGELSLVDSPANQLSNIFSIQKTDTGSVIRGIGADTKVANLFYCDTDEVFQKSLEAEESCINCGKNMEKVGWVEAGIDEAAQVEAAVTKFLSQKEGDNKVEKAADTGEGGVNMADEEKKEEENTGIAETVEGGAADNLDEVVTNEGVDEPTQAEAETAAPADEVNTDEPDLQKMFDSLKTDITAAFDSKADAIAKAVDETVDAKLADVLKKFDAIEADLTEVKTGREAIEKRLNEIDDSSAVQKSVSVEDEDDKELKKNDTSKRGFWSGAILD